MSEYIGGGELFDTIRKFPHKLVQLYVAEIAVALGMFMFMLLMIIKMKSYVHRQY